MNSKSFKSLGLWLNGNSLLILLLGLSPPPPPPVQDSAYPYFAWFFISCEKKTIRISEWYSLIEITQRIWCRSSINWLAGSWFWSVSPNNTGFVMKSTVFWFIFEKSFHLLRRIKQSWTSKFNKLASDVLYSGLMRRDFPLWSWSKLKVILRETVKLFYVKRQVRTCMLRWHL